MVMKVVSSFGSKLLPAYKSACGGKFCRDSVEVLARMPICMSCEMSFGSAAQKKLDSQEGRTKSALGCLRQISFHFQLEFN